MRCRTIKWVERRGVGRPHHYKYCLCLVKEKLLMVREFILLEVWEP